MPSTIAFNIPYITGKESSYIEQAIKGKKLSGDGPFTLKCQQFFEKRYGFKKTFLTTSCSDALEMAAILLDVKAGDEIILPSYTFVSTANAFLLRGAKLIFVDSCGDNPNMDADKIEKAITPKTKAIVVMHYAGVGCDMNKIMQLVQRHKLYLVEDAALGLDAAYNGKALGSFGHLATFSFHETKNICCGEGGLLVINDSAFIKRAEIIREKGTNRSAFFRGEIDKYGWSDVGSSFLPSDILAAFLLAQLEHIDDIQEKRLRLFNEYLKELSAIEKIKLPKINITDKINASLFYFVCKNGEERDQLIAFMKQKGIHATFHYQALHRSTFFGSKEQLPNAERFSDCLVRLPLYPDLSQADFRQVVSTVKEFFS